MSQQSSFQGRGGAQGGDRGGSNAGRGRGGGNADRGHVGGKFPAPIDPTFVPASLVPFFRVFNDILLVLVLIFEFSCHELTGPQAEAAARSVLRMLLEVHDRHSRFFKTSELSFIVRKLFAQLAAVGTKSRLTPNTVLSLVAQSTPNHRCLSIFKENFLDALCTLSVEGQWYWLCVWICVMTMTNVPYTLEWHDTFFRWFDANMSRAPELPAIPKELVILSEVLTDIQVRIGAVFTALPAQPASAEDIKRICVHLKFEAPPSEAPAGDDEDDRGECDTASVAASEKSSVGGSGQRDSSLRFVTGCTAVIELMRLRAQGGSRFFQQLTDPNLMRLIRALLRRMTRRTKGKMSNRTFNNQLCNKLLGIINRHGRLYRINMHEVAFRVFQASGNTSLARQWFDLTDHALSSMAGESEHFDVINRSLSAALVLMKMGDNSIIQGNSRDMPDGAAQILRSAFNDSEINLSAGDAHCQGQVRANVKAAQDQIRAARAGQWRPPHDESDQSCRSRPSGGGAASASPPQRGRPSPPQASVEDQVAALERQIAELRSRC